MKLIRRVSKRTSEIACHFQRRAQIALCTLTRPGEHTSTIHIHTQAYDSDRQLNVIIIFIFIFIKCHEIISSCGTNIEQADNGDASAKFLLALPQCNCGINYKNLLIIKRTRSVLYSISSSFSLVFAFFSFFYWEKITSSSIRIASSL